MPGWDPTGQGVLGWDAWCIGSDRTGSAHKIDASDRKHTLVQKTILPADQRSIIFQRMESRAEIEKALFDGPGKPQSTFANKTKLTMMT